jgi:hypothetical protein
MKQYTNVVIYFAAIFLTAYLVSCFIGASFNPFKWSELTRLVLLALITFAVNKTIENGKK